MASNDLGHFDQGPREAIMSAYNLSLEIPSGGTIALSLENSDSGQMC